MNTTLTLSLPFILLGRDQNINLDDLTYSQQKTYPVTDILHPTLNKLCKNVDVEVNIGEKTNTTPTPHTTTTHNNTNKTNTNKTNTSKRTSVLSQISSPQIHTPFSPSPYSPYPNIPHRQQPRWTIRPGQHSVSLHEHTLLPRSVWTCSFVLERSGIPTDTSHAGWAIFCTEISEVMDVLSQMCEGKAHVNGRDGWDRDLGKGVWWGLVVGAECWGSWTVENCGENEGMKLGDVKNILMMFAGVERDVMSLGTPAGLVRFSPLSRVLERHAVGRMRRFERGVWKGLKGKRGMSEMRIAGAFEKKREKWIEDLDEKQDKMRKTRGREREWWDAVGDMDEEEFRDLVGRLGRGDCVVGVESEKEGDVEEKKSDEEEFPYEDEQNNTDTQTKRDTTSQQQNTTQHLPITSLTINGFKFTLQSADITAHTDLIATLIKTALTPNFQQLFPKHKDITAFLEQLSSSRIPRPITPNSITTRPDLPILTPDNKTHHISNLTHLLTLLLVNDGSQSHLIKQIESSSAVSLDLRNPIEKMERPDARTNPFYDLQERIKKGEKTEKEEMWRFVERYEEVGGWAESGGKKIFRLMRIGALERRNHAENGKERTELTEENLHD